MFTKFGVKFFPYVLQQSTIKTSTENSLQRKCYQEFISKEVMLHFLRISHIYLIYIFIIFFFGFLYFNLFFLLVKLFSMFEVTMYALNIQLVRLQNFEKIFRQKGFFSTFIAIFSRYQIFYLNGEHYTPFKFYYFYFSNFRLFHLNFINTHYYRRIRE